MLMLDDLAPQGDAFPGLALHGAGDERLHRLRDS
jgi:hypothetical protein